MNQREPEDGRRRELDEQAEQRQADLYLRSGEYFYASADLMPPAVVGAYATRERRFYDPGEEAVERYLFPSADTEVRSDRQGDVTLNDAADFLDLGDVSLLEPLDNNSREVFAHLLAGGDKFSAMKNFNLSHDRYVEIATDILRAILMGHEQVPV